MRGAAAARSKYTLSDALAVVVLLPEACTPIRQTPARLETGMLNGTLRLERAGTSMLTDVAAPWLGSAVSLQG